MTAQPLRLSVPFGQMEGRPKLEDEEYADLIERNRARYAADGTGAGPNMRASATAQGFTLQKRKAL